MYPGMSFLILSRDPDFVADMSELIRNRSGAVYIATSWSEANRLSQEIVFEIADRRPLLPAGVRAGCESFLYLPADSPRDHYVPNDFHVYYSVDGLKRYRKSKKDNILKTLKSQNIILIHYAKCQHPFSKIQIMNDYY